MNPFRCLPEIYVVGNECARATSVGVSHGIAIAMVLVINDEAVVVMVERYVIAVICGRWHDGGVLPSEFLCPHQPQICSQKVDNLNSTLSCYSVLWGMGYAYHLLVRGTIKAG